MRSRSSIAAAALVAAASAFSAAALAGPKRLPSAADNIVARATPKRLYLKTAMDEEEIKFYLYLPPSGGPETAQAPAAVPGAAGGPSRAGGPGAAAGPSGAAAAPHAVVVFSGDWGWTPILEDTATVLAQQGRPVLGVDSTQYFLKMLDDAGLAADLAMLRTTLNQQAGRQPGAPM
ncbi:MAG TPA: AcvB/VirJ family lysyl-phosphatidylglycerol hydrolase, partial [Candidatus Polarisedimenticolia bacterium]|nr:AcvB/VirJ family lysyl-phosphatidylglycerol hydrolase [Candidatus Polarisedimenticolia bacterium]